MSREALLVRTLVELADNLVDDFDVIDLLSLLADRCVEILDVSAAGVMLAAPEGDLRVVASSSEDMRVLQLFELQCDEGPCLECFRTGRPVLLDEDLEVAGGHWPRFAPAAVEAGFRAAHALPMRLRGTVIGALNLFDDTPRPLSADDVTAGQALADVATISVLQQRIGAESRVVVDQLHTALNTRIVIEQAKGVLAERSGLSMEASFAALREYARAQGLLLSEVARRLLDKTLPAETFAHLGSPPSA